MVCRASYLAYCRFQHKVYYVIPYIRFSDRIRKFHFVVQTAYSHQEQETAGIIHYLTESKRGDQQSKLTFGVHICVRALHAFEVDNPATGFTSLISDVRASRRVGSGTSGACLLDKSRCCPPRSSHLIFRFVCVSRVPVSRRRFSKDPWPGCETRRRCFSFPSSLVLLMHTYRCC